MEAKNCLHCEKAFERRYAESYAEYAKIRNSKQMAEWRTAVFKRDDYCCQICKARGVHLHAHHIVPFSVNTDLRFALDNGQTLCKECHRMMHSGTNGLKKPAIINGASS